MAVPHYHELHVLDGERVVAWVFVAPQDRPGASIEMGRLDKLDGVEACTATCSVATVRTEPT